MTNVTMLELVQVFDNYFYEYGEERQEGENKLNHLLIDVVGVLPQLLDDVKETIQEASSLYSGVMDTMMDSSIKYGCDCGCGGDIYEDYEEEHERARWEFNEFRNTILEELCEKYNIKNDLIVEDYNDD